MKLVLRTLLLALIVLGSAIHGQSREPAWHFEGPAIGLASSANGAAKDSRCQPTHCERAAVAAGAPALQRSIDAPIFIAWEVLDARASSKPDLALDPPPPRLA
ncbi:MAG: hypothetical protein ACE37J_12065 [Pikeienuella sp.]|uniref:hypothetical protein n=1 Tax=Pikeienuella sp. TaxID=2831957 RepID=UPI00391AD6D3